MNQHYKDIIAREFRNCVTNTIGRLENEETYRPFHRALLSTDALFWSRFERSFSTSFGQRVIEEISKNVALSGGATSASRQKESMLVIDSGLVAAIDTHLTSIREGKSSNSWPSSIQAINQASRSGINITIRVISDLWWVRNGINHYMSIKTVKPNIDQTAVAKRDLLLLAAADPSCKAYFGLYYNPYGADKTSYSHTPPMGIFDFRHDEVVLIGKEYWDTLGGNGCYEEVLSIANEVGLETRNLVQRLR